MQDDIKTLFQMHGFRLAGQQMVATILGYFPKHYGDLDVNVVMRYAPIPEYTEKIMTF